jgi:ribosomal protein S12 methylthiotransferase accessory factor
MTDIHVRFTGGQRIEAKLGAHHVVTDQSLAHGGDDSAPEPFELFLASLVTCAGSYVLGYCRSRGIPSEQIELIQRQRFDHAGHLTNIELELLLPASFPDAERAGLVRAAQSCKVHKTLQRPPQVVVSARTVPNDDEVATATSL